jgi:hypothetical protein
VHMGAGLDLLRSKSYLHFAGRQEPFRGLEHTT